MTQTRWKISHPIKMAYYCHYPVLSVHREKLHLKFKVAYLFLARHPDKHVNQTNLVNLEYVKLVI